jgi:predicted ferric reductase
VTTTATRPALTDPIRRARAARLRAADRAWVIEMIVTVNAALIIGMWLRHGGVSASGGRGGVATAAGQLTGLLGTYSVLLQLLLMARLPWLERYVGLDRLAIWHRWNGVLAVNLLVAHTALITIGYAASNHATLWAQTRDFISNYADVLMAFAALVILIAIGITSARAARRRLRRETWYFVHLYAYLAVALGFAHQLAVGNDFVTDPIARAWWVALYLVVITIVVTSRVIRPWRFNARHQISVESVAREAPGVVTIKLTGRQLGAIRAHPGQFFLWRFLTRDGWWKANPFSLSAAPTRKNLRITVKDLGDTTHDLQTIRNGTRVFAEGPFGTFTAHHRTGRPTLFIAGGIGITPIRAMLDESSSITHCTLLYRVNRREDIVFAKELAEIASRRGVDVHYLIGVEIGDDQTDQLGIPAIKRLVPDVTKRDCFVCGPPALIDAVRRRLHVIGVPDAFVHFEKFEF